MNEDKETNELLQKILKVLAKNEARMETEDKFSENKHLIKKAEKEGEEAAKNIQSSFDRIHDKLFTINSILVASFLGLSKFPADDPIFSLWIALAPIFNIFYLLILEKYQMEIYRHSSERMNWNFDTDVAKYGRMIRNQNLRSLLAIITTLGLCIFLAVKIVIY